MPDFDGALPDIAMSSLEARWDWPWMERRTGLGKHTQHIELLCVVNRFSHCDSLSDRFTVNRCQQMSTDVNSLLSTVYNDIGVLCDHFHGSACWPGAGEDDRLETGVDGRNPAMNP